MSRTPRLFLSQSYYHIIARGNNRLEIFKVKNDFQYYLDLISRYKPNHPFDLFHYCLMPNHIHLLIKTNKASDFSNFMKRMNLAYFYHYKTLYGWVGHLWQDRFRSQLVGKDEYFIQCGKYIELNPIRAKLVQKPEDYRWSSYNFYTQGEDNNLITEDLFYQDLGKNILERQLKYSKIMIDEIVLKNYSKIVWGTDYQKHQENKKIKYNLKK